MFTQPEDLTDDAVAETLERGWGLAVQDIAYAAVGFGSHHWSVVGDDVQWFVTADDLDARVKHARDTRTQVRQRLASALSTACALQQRGCSYVVAPTLSRTGSVLEDIDERYVVAVYPHVDGRTGSCGRYDTQAERFAVVDRLVEIHAAGDSVESIAGLDDFGVPSRDRLMTALVETSSPWSTGPFAERTRSLLDRHAGGLTTALNTFDDLVALVRRRGVGPVVTHGEPHRGNVIFTSEGVSLIDWDTTLLAPRSRPLVVDRRRSRGRRVLLKRVGTLAQQRCTSVVPPAVGSLRGLARRHRVPCSARRISGHRDGLGGAPGASRSEPMDRADLTPSSPMSPRLDEAVRWRIAALLRRGTRSEMCTSTSDRSDRRYPFSSAGSRTSLKLLRRREYRAPQ